MKCYKVLSGPIYKPVPNYKGLYRCETGYPQSENNKQLIYFWEQSIQHIEPFTSMGITTELTIDELKRYANLATKEEGEDFEVIFFSEHKECPHQAEYYGIDVTGLGGYSMLAGNCFLDRNENDTKDLLDVLNQYFRPRLNTFGLFNEVDDAVSFRTVLNDLNTLSPGYVEQEDWQILHIFKVS
jgi:hypothetical protein